MKKKIQLFPVLLYLSVISCQHTNDTVESTLGDATVKINFKGAEFSEDISGINASANTKNIQETLISKKEIVFNNDDYKLVATLTPVNNTQTKLHKALVGNKMAVANTLDSGILYKVVVFDSNGKYKTEKDYKVGQESTAGSITGLNGDGEYTFVVYSIGSKTSNSQITFANPANPILSEASLNLVSGDSDLMYFSKKIIVTGNKANYLEVILRHKYSQIITTLDSSPTSNYIILSASNVAITSHNNFATLKLSDGSITSTGSSSKTIVFPIGSTQKLIAAPSLINVPVETKNATLNIGSIILQTAPRIAGFNTDVTHQNISFNNLTITPGVKYSLTLSFIPNDRDMGEYRGYPAVRMNGLIWMRHNLGANYALNPNVPQQSLFGNYYQFGKKAVAASATASDASISGWSSTLAPTNSWNSGTDQNPVKTVNDPCPSGWRIPTLAEAAILSRLTTGTTVEYLGDVTRSSSTNYTAAIVIRSRYNPNVQLTIPFSGGRTYNTGALDDFYNTSSNETRARGVSGALWTSSVSSNSPIKQVFYGTRYTGIPINYYTSMSADGTTNMQNAGLPIRCIAEYPY
ncbi:hypothetical protein CMU01_00570 [Elizabethkingia anophelis]|nr:hypothetical protein [Elizabethkingia anophelis]